MIKTTTKINNPVFLSYKECKKIVRIAEYLRSGTVGKTITAKQLSQVFRDDAKIQYTDRTRIHDAVDLLDKLCRLGMAEKSAESNYLIIEGCFGNEPFKRFFESNEYCYKGSVENGLYIKKKKKNENYWGDTLCR